MSLNKWLCEHMDFGDKGYVTVWDVAKGVFCISALVVFMVAGGIMSVYMYFIGAAMLVQPDISYAALIHGDDAACVGMFVFINAATIIVVSVKVAHKLASIRVATCERRD